MKNSLLTSYCIVVFTALFFVLIPYNAPLGFALLVLSVLTGGTIFSLWKAGIKDRKLYILLLFVTLVYLGFALFIYYANFYPFGGGEGDQRFYHRAAVGIANDFRQGHFSFEGIKMRLNNETITHFYPVLIGVLYALTIPDKLVGIMVSVWFAALSALLIYFLALEIGASKKWAFWSGLSVCFYPSLLYWGSLLLRESMVAGLTLFCLLLTIKIIKQFTWAKFVFFYIALGALIHLRFYLGLLVLFVFVFSLVFLFSGGWKKKLQYGIIVIPLLGFLPQVVGTGHGYYMVNDLKYFFNRQRIAEYRAVPGIYESDKGFTAFKDATQPPSFGATPSVLLEDVLEKSLPGQKGPDQIPSTKGVPSSLFIKETLSQNPFVFAKNYVYSFVYIVLGPFPWDIHYVRQLFVLGETIPWLVVFFYIMRAFILARSRWKTILPIVLVALGIFAEIALLINAYGISMRIRIPAFLLLIALLPFAFQKKETLAGQAEKIT